MTTTLATNIGRFPVENGFPRDQPPRPKQEWWLGDKRVKVLPLGARPTRRYFQGNDGFDYRPHDTDPNLALRRSNGREREAGGRPSAELLADPKWAGKLLERRTRTTTAKTIRNWRWATLELSPTFLAYYGLTEKTEVKATGSGIRRFHFTTTTYALTKTPETPNAFPIDSPNAVHLLWRNFEVHKHPTFTAIYEAEATRQGKPAPDLTRFLERGTTFKVVPYHTTLISYADGRTRKTTTKQLDERTAELPQPTLLLLTGFSTKAKATPIPQLHTTNTLDWDFKLKPLYANLEATRRLKAELKREICEAVFHPDRIDRMATKFDLHGADYTELLDGGV
jgi:hypothetical protein